MSALCGISKPWWNGPTGDVDKIFERALALDADHAVFVDFAQTYGGVPMRSGPLAITIAADVVIDEEEYKTLKAIWAVVA
jgi:hypothetical protein